MLTASGKPGSINTALTGAAGSGLPKSGSAGEGPTPRQSAKYLVISCSNVLGSTSPEMAITARSGRYQRSWNARRLAGVAALSVAVVPIGGRVATNCPAKNSVRVASPARTAGPGCSRASASTVRRSVSTPLPEISGPAIMPERILMLSSSPSGVAPGRSSL